VSVRERAEIKDGKLVRRFRVTGVTTTWFAVPEGATGLEVIAGIREGAYYRLNGAAAQEFTVTHTIPAVPLVPPDPGASPAPAATR
jgi:hypothetical protein